MVWMNNDGLLVKFGKEKGIAANGGSYRFVGPLDCIEIDVDYRKLNAFGTNTILSDTVKVPNGVLLKSAEFQVDVAFTGATATLTLGLYDSDRTTAYDEDGIDATIALTAIDAIGEVVACDGALIGTVLANNTPSLITALVGTANFTAGRGKLRLYFYRPTVAATPAT